MERDLRAYQQFNGNKISYYSSVLWIPIRIDLAVLDPDPYRDADPDPDPGAWKLTKINKTNMVSCLPKRFLHLRMYVFHLLPTLNIM
jgi:hypothetical protein